MAKLTAHGFQPGHGYNSKRTGNFYVYVGESDRLLVFYRSFSDRVERLTEREAWNSFGFPPESQGKVPSDYRMGKKFLTELRVI